MLWWRWLTGGCGRFGPDRRGSGSAGYARLRAVIVDPGRVFESMTDPYPNPAHPISNGLEVRVDETWHANASMRCSFLASSALVTSFSTTSTTTYPRAARGGGV